MKLLMMIPLLVLAGCATNVVLKDSSDTPKAEGTLYLNWLQSNRMEANLDGRRYEGKWESQRCFTPECRGAYWNVLRIHRRHISQGQAILFSKDGGRLECEWVSHLPEVKGSCRAQDGRVFRLTAG